MAWASGPTASRPTADLSTDASAAGASSMAEASNTRGVFTGTGQRIRLYNIKLIHHLVVVEYTGNE